jgi:hypothetical protein
MGELEILRFSLGKFLRPLRAILAAIKLRVHAFAGIDKVNYDLVGIVIRLGRVSDHADGFYIRVLREILGARIPQIFNNAIQRVICHSISDYGLVLQTEPSRSEMQIDVDLG